MKTCKQCGNEYPLSEYFKDKRSSDGCISICKKCYSIKYNKSGRYYDKEGNLKCRECKVYKPENEYYYDKNQKYRNFKSQDCIECQKVNTRLKRLQGYEDSIEKVISNVYNAMNTRSKGVHELSREILFNMYNSQKGMCAISGLIMTGKRGVGKNPYNVSIDQIIAGKGYTLDNVQLVCAHVNMMKSTLTVSELVLFCKAIIKEQV